LKSRKPVVSMVGAGTDRTMSGAHLRRARLFNVASGRALITAFDHGITLGPMPGSEAAVGALKCIVGVGPDGILIFPGNDESGAKGLGYSCNVWQADDPVPMCRLLSDVIHGAVAPFI
jgi:DhnA family fructose-bisphosphate aldolase class Ia